MDKRHNAGVSPADATAALLAGIDSIARSEALMHLRQWLVLLQGLAMPFGGPEKLRMAQAALSLEAQPATDECRCGRHQMHSQLIRARLSTPRSSGVSQRVAGKAAMPGLTMAWAMLTTLVEQSVPGHQHTAFVLDYGSRLLGCWHDWACLECNGTAPCLVVDLATVMAWDAAATPGPDPLGHGPAGPAMVPPASHPPAPPGRTDPALVPTYPAVAWLDTPPRAGGVILADRMQRLGIPLPCAPLAGRHDGRGEGAA